MKHGTSSMYRGGCHCDECRQAHAIHVQEWRLRKTRVRLDRDNASNPDERRYRYEAQIKRVRLLSGEWVNA